MAFEAEITQSIRELQGAVAKLSSEVGKSNAGLRQTQQAVRGVASETRAAADAARQHNRSMNELQKSTKTLGGSAGGMVKEFMELGSLNPKMLVMGGIFGGLAAGAAAFAANVKQAKEQMDALAKASKDAGDNARQAFQDSMAKAAATINPERVRSKYGNAITRKYTDADIAKLATDTGVSEEEAMRRIQAARASAASAGQGAFGRAETEMDYESLYIAATGDANANFQSAHAKRLSTGRNITGERFGADVNELADRIAGRQQEAARVASEREVDLAIMGAGGTLSGGRIQELYQSQEGLTKAVQELTDQMKAITGTGRMYTMNPSLERGRIWQKTEETEKDFNKLRNEAQIYKARANTASTFGPGN